MLLKYIRIRFMWYLLRNSLICHIVGWELLWSVSLSVVLVVMFDSRRCKASLIDLKSNERREIKWCLKSFWNGLNHLIWVVISSIVSIVLTFLLRISFIIIHECSCVISFGVNLIYNGLYPFFFQNDYNPCVNPKLVPK